MWSHCCFRKRVKLVWCGEGRHRFIVVVVVVVLSCGVGLGAWWTTDNLVLVVVKVTHMCGHKKEMFNAISYGHFYTMQCVYAYVIPHG